eukprot:2922324-Rhodomonas_salina.1
MPTKKLAYEWAQAAKYEQGILALRAQLKEMEQKVTRTPQTVPSNDAGVKRKRPSPVKDSVYKKDSEADQSTEPWKTIFPSAALFVFSELGPEALAFSETKKDSAELFRLAVEEEMVETWYDEHVIPRRDV